MDIKLIVILFTFFYQLKSYGNQNNHLFKFVDPFFFEQIDIPVINGYDNNKYVAKINYDCESLKNENNLQRDLFFIYVNRCKSLVIQNIVEPLVGFCAKKKNSHNLLIFKNQNIVNNTYMRSIKNLTLLDLFDSMLLNLNNEIELNFKEKIDYLNLILENENFVLQLFKTFDFLSEKKEPSCIYSKYAIYSKFVECEFDVEKMDLNVILLEPKIEEFKTLVGLVVFNTFVGNCVLEYKGGNALIYDQKLQNYCFLLDNINELNSTKSPIMNSCKSEKFEIRNFKPNFFKNCEKHSNSKNQLLKVHQTGRFYRIYCFTFLIKIANKEIFDCPNSVIEISIDLNFYFYFKDKEKNLTLIYNNWHKNDQYQKKISSDVLKKNVLKFKIQPDKAIVNLLIAICIIIKDIINIYNGISLFFLGSSITDKLVFCIILIFLILNFLIFLIRLIRFIFFFPKYLIFCISFFSKYLRKKLGKNKLEKNTELSSCVIELKENKNTEKELEDIFYNSKNL